MFAAAVGRILYNRRHNKPLGWPVFLVIFLFNAANIYLIGLGKHIPGWMYGVVGVTTLVSGYFTFKNVWKQVEEVK